MRYYSTEEDQLIRQHVRENADSETRLSGNSFWRDLESKNIIKGRSWHSLRERYLKYLRNFKPGPVKKLTKRKKKHVPYPKEPSPDQKILETASSGGNSSFEESDESYSDSDSVSVRKKTKSNRIFTKGGCKSGVLDESDSSSEKMSSASQSLTNVPWGKTFLKEEASSENSTIGEGEMSCNIKELPVNICQSECESALASTCQSVPKSDDLADDIQNHVHYKTEGKKNWGKLIEGSATIDNSITGTSGICIEKVVTLNVVSTGVQTDFVKFFESPPSVRSVCTSPPNEAEMELLDSKKTLMVDRKPNRMLPRSKNMFLKNELKTPSNNDDSSYVKKKPVFRTGLKAFKNIPQRTRKRRKTRLRLKSRQQIQGPPIRVLRSTSS